MSRARPPLQRPVRRPAGHSASSGLASAARAAAAWNGWQTSFSSARQSPLVTSAISTSVSLASMADSQHHRREVELVEERRWSWYSSCSRMAAAATDDVGGVQQREGMPVEEWLAHGRASDWCRDHDDGLGEGGEVLDRRQSGVVGDALLQRQDRRRPTGGQV